ncbi:glycosyltransferase family 4 protein [Candidatus Sororendozoicomonas aggregata]|uniref:glycosyltransferase family 4 protein n=1 Tax=Candidatus Sororendozoicomonas aggregata TaxID=3073239 RepID=UPI002ED14A94
MVTPENHAVSFVLYHYFPHGGLQQDFLKTALACQRLGYAVSVYTTRWEGQRPEGFVIHQMPVNGSTNHRRMVNFQQAILAEKKAGDLLLIGFNKMAGLDIYFASDTCYRKKGLTERSWLYRLTPRYKIFEQLERAVFGHESSSHALVLTQRQVMDFQTHYQTPEERFTLLPPGIARNDYIDKRQSTRDSIRKSLSLSDSDIMLLLVGSRFKTKGLDRAISALAALPEVLQKKTSLVVAGGDKPDGYQRQAEKSGIANQVVFLGARDNVQQLMVAADVLVHPARTESAGMVLVEAIAAGLPVIVTDNCGYAHHVERADAGIVVPAGPYQQKQLNTAVQMMVGSGSLDYWQQQGLRYAAEMDLYSLHEQAAQIIDQHFKQRYS